MISYRKSSSLSSIFISVFSSNVLKQLLPFPASQCWIFRNFCELVVKYSCYGESHGGSINTTEIGKCHTAICFFPQELCIVLSWTHYFIPSLSHITKIHCKTSHVNIHGAASFSSLSPKTTMLNVWSENPLQLLSISDWLEGLTFQGRIFFICIT